MTGYAPSVRVLGIAVKQQRQLMPPGTSSGPPCRRRDFWIFDDRLVALETPTAGIEVTRPQEVELYVRMFEHLHGAAVYGQAARDVITKVANELR